jgi:hypothetical protein
MRFYNSRIQKPNSRNECMGVFLELDTDSRVSRVWILEFKSLLLKAF